MSLAEFVLSRQAIGGLVRVGTKMAEEDRHRPPDVECRRDDRRQDKGLGVGAAIWSSACVRLRCRTPISG